MPTPAPVVSLLDVDADLGEGLDPESFAHARRRAVARVFALKQPVWDADGVRTIAQPDWQGLFVVDGLMLRRTTMSGRSAAEVLGPGDLFRPWDDDGPYDPLSAEVDYVLLEPVRVALLDREFSLRIAPWPSISSRIIGRAARRARHLAVLQAVTSLTRVHARILLLLWILGERWGRVTADGVVIRLPVTHHWLAILVGCHRPTVTIALSRLTREGLLGRPGPDRWLLTQRALDMVADPDRLTTVADPDRLTTVAMDGGTESVGVAAGGAMPA